MEISILKLRETLTLLIILIFKSNQKTNKLSKPENAAETSNNNSNN